MTDIEIPDTAVRCIKLATKHDKGEFYNRLWDFMELAIKLELEVNRLRAKTRTPRRGAP